MKRLLALALALVMCLSMFACGKDYSRHQITFLGDDFSWDMTEEEVYEYISKNQLIENEIEIDRYDTFTTISDDMYVFHLDKEGKIEFVKYDMGYDSNMVSILTEWYGEYDQYKEKFDQYIWFGTMSERNVKMTFWTVSGQCWLEFKLA